MISSNNIPENLDELQNWLHNKEQKAGVLKTNEIFAFIIFDVLRTKYDE